MRLESGYCAWEIMATVSVAWVWEGVTAGEAKGKGLLRGCERGRLQLAAAAESTEDNQHYRHCCHLIVF